MRRDSKSSSSKPVLKLFVPLLLLVAGNPLSHTPVPAVANVPANAPLESLSMRAAAAIRQHDCAGAISLLASAVATPGPQQRLATLMDGFYAESCDAVGEAEERLFAAHEPGGPLEDWRLYLLADAAHARGHVLLARAALAKLLGDYPKSPLRPRALLRAATFAWEQQDRDRALALVAQARREDLRGDESTALESLAWEIGCRLNDQQVRTAAARQLLIASPAKAAVLNVAEALRSTDGELNWSSLLTPEQLKRRAQSLLALELEPSALAALDQVTVGGRDLEWSLLKAETLARLHRGDAAAAVLGPLRGASPKDEAAIEWQRAMAAADLATAQRGRENLAAAQRVAMRQEMRRHLEKVATSTGDPAIAIRALRLLYLELNEENLFDASLVALRRLRTLDSRDVTGANPLWMRGWQEFVRGNYTGAVGYWAELGTLYPDDTSARRGRYWSARAFDALGEHARAQSIYVELMGADTDDFYRRNATARLSHTQLAAHVDRASIRSEPWPTDPRLERARLLTDWGLDRLASDEMDMVGAQAQPLAAKALKALILAREGQRKDSVLAIREAFPALGGPYQASLPEQALRLYYPLDYELPIRTYSRERHVPPYLIYGIIRQESAFDANALSTAGARGLMQLMPGTARELARGLGLSFSRDRIADPTFNIQVGTAYVKEVLQMFDNNLELALAGYNGGPYRIKRLWHQYGSHDIDRFLEGLTIEQSKIYVKRILVLSDSYRQLYPDAG